MNRISFNGENIRWYIEQILTLLALIEPVSVAVLLLGMV